MTLLTGPIAPRPEAHAVSVEGGCLPCSPAALDPFLYQQMRWCVNCGGEQVFVEVFETDFGRVGCCLGCGEERVVQFSRTTEAA